MPKYLLTMNGVNFLVAIGGKLAKHGFYQNFYLESDSPDSAEYVAHELIRSDKSLTNITENSESDSPDILLDDIFELDSFDGDSAMISEKAWYEEEGK